MKSQIDDFKDLSLRVDSKGFAWLIFERAEALNTLTLNLRREIREAVDYLITRGDVHVLLVTGRGKAFSAGLAIDEWDTAGAPCAGAWAENPVAALLRFPGTVVGVINGLCVTGGLELALSMDFLIAADHARFADTHALVGLLPGWGGSVRLIERLGRARAKEMALTGRFVTAKEALAWGLVNHLYPATELEAEAERMAESLLAGPAAQRARYKELLNAGADLPSPEALNFEQARAIFVNAPVTAEDLNARLGALRGRG